MARRNPYRIAEQDVVLSEIKNDTLTSKRIAETAKTVQALNHALVVHYDGDDDVLILSAIPQEIP